MDAENMRDFVSYHKKLWNENSARELAQNSKIQKVIPIGFHGDFLLKIGIICFRDKRKNIPFLKHEGPPLVTPTFQYHGMYAILWKCMTRFPILHMFAYVLR